MRPRRDPQAELISEDHIEAAFRYRIVAPLLDKTLPRDEVMAYRRKILRQQQEHPTRGPVRINARTLRRWKQKYREAPPQAKVESLCPLPRTGGRPLVLPEKAVDLAQQLLVENPRRKTEFLITEIELKCPELKGLVKPSTLNRYLRVREVNRRVLGDDGQPAQDSFKPFEATKPNALWQSDVHNGPKAIFKGEIVPTKIIGWLDDYSRASCHLQAYPNETSPMLEHCLGQAVQQYGIPTCGYTDRGSIYSGVQFSLTCADLQMTTFMSAPYSPWTHGKVERLWGVQEDQLFSEIALVPPMPIERLNDYLRYWRARYHRQVHSQTGQTPLDRWNEGLKLHKVQLRHPSEAQLKRIFWIWARRVVSATSLVKLHNNTYAVDPALAGQTVLVRHDPFDLKVIQVWSNHPRHPELHGEFTAQAPLVSPQAPRPAAPPKDHAQHSEAAQRYLDRLEQEYQSHLHQQFGLLDYRVPKPPSNQGGS